MDAGRLGIVVGGGPAPGINSAISAATIEAVNSGLQVVGIYDGFEHLVLGRTDMVRPLSISDVSRIHYQGGSILRTSRASATATREDTLRIVAALRELKIGRLILIGGDGTSVAGAEISEAAEGAIQLAQVPKTIDNDLSLPGGMPTFGFETARHVGTELVLNLMEDSRTTNRWFFVAVMGRSVGHLALGIGKAAGATVTLIPEEFPRQGTSLKQVCQVLEASILKRRALGSMHGVAVIAEGIAARLTPDDLTSIPGVQVEHDQSGQLRLGEIPLAQTLKREVQSAFARRGDPISIVDVTLGYGLRSASPIPFDMDYTRTLGYGAVRFLLSDQPGEPESRGGLVCLENGHLRVIPYKELLDPATGRAYVRHVDVTSESYTVAREYMIRTDPEDLEDPAMLGKLAEAGRMTPEEFKATFAWAATRAS